MNIFKFELKSVLKNSIIWLVVLLALNLIFMKAMYPLYVDGAKDIEKVLANFPKEFAKAFELNMKEIFSYGGFYSFCSNYILLCGAIMSVYLGVSTFGREKKAKTMDFLFTKPISREKIFIIKLLSNVSILIITNIIFIISAYFIYKSSGDTTTTIEKVLLATSGLFFTQLVFLSLGIIFAIFTKKIRSIAGIAMAFGFGGFIISAVANIIGEEILNYIAPMKYFAPSYVFSNGVFEIKYVITAVVIIIVCLGTSFIKYKNGDIQAV
ncbi:ABC transporter permease subunit [uncultured Clostridium sp.]|uniref:ABC transporter permease subunit n=1 Tax=uncultured Clostridium sp. TaxID=59620 RepID=UPI0025857392|nr:ABC transporter permease subunit [uncultured Clostridium sp.]